MMDTAAPQGSLQADDCSLEEACKDVELAPVTEDADDESEPALCFKDFWRYAGPGILMCTAFIDPGDLESDVQVGSMYLYTLLWIFLWSTVMGYIMQMLAAKLGVASGKDLCVLCREQYPPFINITLWLAMEAALVGVEIQYLIGAAIGLQLLCTTALPLWASVIICSFLSYVTLYIDYFGLKVMEVAFYVMISVMAVTFIVLAGVAGAPGVDVIRGLAIPKLPSGAALVAGGIVGGAMTPYNFYFFSTLVLKRDTIPMVTRGQKRLALKYFGIEAGITLFLALLMNVCIVCTFASAYGFGAPEFDYAAANAGLFNAGDMLAEQFGRWSYYIWAVGMFATGISSAAASVYAGQTIMSGFVEIKLPMWQRAVVTRTISIIPAVVVAATQTTADEIDTMNMWLNLLQTIALPFALLPLLHFTSSKLVMGRHWANGWPLILVAGAITAFGIFMAVYGTALSITLPTVGYAWALAIIGCVVYGAAITYFVIGPDRVGRCCTWVRRKVYDARHGTAAAAQQMQMQLYPSVSLESKKSGSGGGDAASALKVAVTDGPIERGQMGVLGEGRGSGSGSGSDAQHPAVTKARE